HGERPDLVLMGITLELVGKAVAGSPGAGALRIAALDHEVGEDPVELRAVIELIPGQEYEIVYRHGRICGEQLANDFSARSTERRRVLLVHIDAQGGGAGVLFLRADFSV